MEGLGIPLSQVVEKIGKEKHIIYLFFINSLRTCEPEGLMVRRPQSGERIQGPTQLIGFPRVSK